MMDREQIFARMKEDLEFLLSTCATHDSDDLWSTRMEEWKRKILTAGDTINAPAVESFRKSAVFINEVPHVTSLFPVNWISGSRRAQFWLMRDRFTVVEREGDLEYLKKHPISPVGNPCFVEMDGCRFNKRWSNNIRYLSLSARCLGDVLSSGDARLLDIGGGYGIYPLLLKKEFGGVKSAVVEFPEQLLLTYYFLASSFPDAKINTLQAAYDAAAIDRTFIDEYDFVLIPIGCYGKIEKGAFNVVANFFSFGEMSEEWFHTYVDGDAYQGADYCFTINRFESRPTYPTNLNVLDYRLHEYETLHFQVSPYEKYTIRGRWVFWWEKLYYESQFFEFIGKKK
ncbi:putative sugar O-methyltransferase [Verrucomicrobiota bacterium]